MLERVWRKGDPLALLVGMQTSTATMENSVEIPLQYSCLENPMDRGAWWAAVYVVAKSWA